jgi:uncharacterized membrane protein YGL010W
MKSFNEQVLAYAAYHQDARNKATHFLGVPLVTISLFVLLGWLRFLDDPVPITGATLFWLTVFIYYLILDWRIALLQAPFTLLLLAGADLISRWPFLDSAAVFLATFVGGWIIQLAGHAIEGKRPALADNVLQIFNAPLFLVVEVLQGLGFRRELRHSSGSVPCVNIPAAPAIDTTGKGNYA